MKNFKEDLKDAICNEDIGFLQMNEKKYSVNERFEDENNDTLLLYSLSDSKSKAYKYFLKNNADSTLLNDDGENVIHSIVYSGDPERLPDFLSEGNINHQSKDGTTPLLLAIALEKDTIAHLLIEHGADVNIADHEGNAPIHIAAHLGKIDLVSVLVDKGANVLAKTKKGNLPLALAVNAGHDDVVKYLFRKTYK